MESSSIPSLLTVMVIGIGTIVATLGLASWKHQLKGRADYELTRRLLKGVYSIREAIAGVRSPFQSVAEIASAMNKYFPDAKVDILDMKNRAMQADAVFKSRWKKVVDADLDYQVDVLEGEVLWGPKAREQLTCIQATIMELFTAYDLIIRDDYTNGAVLGETRGVFQEITIAAPDESKDAYKKKLHNRISEIELFLRPHLRL